MPDEFEQIGSFLSRWSRRKLERQPQKDAPGTPPPVPAADAQAESAPPAVSAAAEDPVAKAPELPPAESLTPASDFTQFMQPEVEAGVKRAALKQLFKDPHFNVMDGLDTYIEDYSVADPIPAGMLKTMYQTRQHVFSEEERAIADAADAAEAEELAAAEELRRHLEADAVAPGDGAAEVQALSSEDPIRADGVPSADSVPSRKDA